MVKGARRLTESARKSPILGEPALDGRSFIALTRPRLPLLADAVEKGADELGGPFYLSFEGLFSCCLRFPCLA